MRIEFTALAVADFDSIVDYSNGQFGEHVARNYVSEIERAVGRLATHPRSGRVEHHFHRDARSIGCQSHRIYYSIDDGQIIVRRILHQSMDAGKWLG